ncbi:hypothetical protein [Fibrobacter sp.]|uniref:hypothetical protein n=1 Tax=Fibrobacter sp. TaxID=35828 RepID=UPI00388D65D8
MFLNSALKRVQGLFCSIALLSSTVFAVGFYGNQSDVKWKTAGTDHFQFIYPTEYSDHAAAISTYAEAVYDSVVTRYKKDLPRRVNASLNNALYSNGSAIPSENAINLWLTNWDFKVRSSHGWMADVVTHEFSHLVSIENGSKVPSNIYGLQASYTDYYNERTTSDFMTLVPFTLQPLWFAEGTAQFESSRMGFDAWDTHRDMLLRVAVLNDSLLPLEYMHDFSDNSLFAELGPYTQGFSLVRYIAKHYGEDAVPKIWTELSRPYRATLDGALKKVLGISEKELYEAWKKELQDTYGAQKDSLGTLVEGIKITEDAFWQDFPVVAGKNLYGISNFGGPWFDGSVFKIPLDEAEGDSTESDTDSTKNVVDGVEIGDVTIDEPDTDSLIDISEFAQSGFKAKKPWFDKGIDVYEDSIHGPILAYVSYQNRDKDGHAHFDIAVSDTNKKEFSITYLADAVYPAFDKQGTSVIFARREPFSTRFVLSKVPINIAEFGEATSEDPIDLFVPDKNLKYYNIYSPKFSPDGKRIAFSYFDDKIRGIAIIDSDGSNFKIVSNENFDERDVEWLDNEKIVFSSNRNGIFNLFEKNLATGAERPLTNVIGGAFTPTLTGDTIFFTQYDKDGFSLYKLGYGEQSVNVTTRDSIIQIADTTWSVCPEIADTAKADTIAAVDTLAVKDSTTASADSIARDSTARDSSAQTAEPCKPMPTVTMRDSVIKIEVRDTVKIVLHGNLQKPVAKPLELVNREFAGAERDYKPIPTVPMFVPILSFNENAPDLTVFGEGETKAKLGLAVILSDPLKKNVVQLGLLLELGKGIDYINADGLNPEQEKEFFVSWLNTSTPLDLGLAYSYANYTSRDTVRYEDVRAHGGDSIGMSNYAIPMQSIVGMAGYSIFKSIDTLHVAVGYDWADFNLYEDEFSWTYQKRISVLTALGLYGDLAGEDASGINGQGNGILLYHQYSNSDLYRPGTFAESFYVTESGSIKPKYRNFNINEIGLNIYGSLQSPLTGARLAAGAKVSGIINWNTDADQDTLDSYYYNPVLLEGYPYLRSSEDYTRAGTKNAMAEVHYLFPIYEDWRKSAWIFGTRDFYIDIFAQMGAAWNTKWFDTDKLTDHDFWDRDVGLSFRMSNKIFYSIPLDISLTFARGLSRIGENEDLSGGWKLTPIDLPLLPKDICPTRIKFAIGMGFINTWQ